MHSVLYIQDVIYNFNAPTRDCVSVEYFDTTTNIHISLNAWLRKFIYNRMFINSIFFLFI